MKTIGIISQRPEAGALFFTRCCEEGARRLGAGLHPDIVLTTASVGLTMPAYALEDPEVAAPYFRSAVDRLYKAGADFYLCPVSISHHVLAMFADEAPIPCLHIADVVADELVHRVWKRIGFLGNRLTMTGTVYRRSFRRAAIEKLIPEAATHSRLDELIFGKALRGPALEAAHDLLLGEIDKFKARDADCVVVDGLALSRLVPTERASLPILDTTQLLPRAAVSLAVADEPLRQEGGWVVLGSEANTPATLVP